MYSCGLSTILYLANRHIAERQCLCQRSKQAFTFKLVFQELPRLVDLVSWWQQSARVGCMYRKPTLALCCHQETRSTSLGNSWNTSLKVKACLLRWQRHWRSAICRENRRKATTTRPVTRACVCMLELDCIVNSCIAEITLQMCSV